MAEALFIYLDGVDRRYLNDEQKVILCMLKLEMEVNNGGFDQFFFNTENEWNNILISSAQQIGTSEVANICENAIKILQSDLDEETQMQRLNDECDNAFYKSKDCISCLCVQYARQHKESFVLE